MLRSMYAGISGMKNFQTKLDVIGNNIANVNTSGFKKGRVTFQDMMAQTTTGAQAPIPGSRGGSNAVQVGLGSQIGSIDNIHTQGFRQTTNNPLDLTIEGDGMFVLSAGGDETYFTRAGNFYLDDNGYIVNPDGYYLQGFPATNDVIGNQQDRLEIPENAQSFSISSNGTVNYIDANNNTRIAGQITLAKFSNPSGLQLSGSNLYMDSPNAGRVALQNGTDIFTPDTNGVGALVSGSLEMSNVDLAEEFTEMITAQRGFQANTRIITTSDEILQELVNLKR
ncbi:flagellar basal body rod protein FlgG [Oceanobacillus zhaokaii]|uniref:Flagellar hook protein FlgE n=1 Tax=Oceanobacillus zhaokaii TaxID=2052660 RepID=A0A345PGF9_9BACI|nr:flagellar basal body rod protein FlgG [Oceanobacillus zhaokaii]AXI09089.1 flagellar basal body rod protein FlgG [Oceanobacillus zhaokaii]